MDTRVQLKPYSEACERNKHAIADALKRVFPAPGSVLEIASGTGQHAVHFASELPHVTWHCSDLPERLAGIVDWLEEAGLENVVAPVALDVCTGYWPQRHFDYAFSANSSHIMSWPAVVCMFEGVASILTSRGLFALYGPFNVAGQYTSDSNRRFDEALRLENSDMGLRDIEAVVQLAAASGLAHTENIEMPANNRLLIFAK